MQQYAFAIRGRSRKTLVLLISCKPLPDVRKVGVVDASILAYSMKSLADGYEKAAAVIEEKRPGQVVGLDDEKTLRAYRAMLEHYRHLQKGAEDALKSLIEGKKKWG